MAPKLLVTRSMNEVVRLGANNCVTSTEPLKNAPVHMATATTTMKPAPRRAIAMARRKPQGTNKSTFPCTSRHEPPVSGRAQIRSIRFRISSPGAEKLNGSVVA